MFALVYILMIYIVDSTWDGVTPPIYFELSSCLNDLDAVKFENRILKNQIRNLQINQLKEQTPTDYKELECSQEGDQEPNADFKARPLVTMSAVLTHSPPPPIHREPRSKSAPPAGWHNYRLLADSPMKLPSADNNAISYSRHNNTLFTPRQATLSPTTFTIRSDTPTESRQNTSPQPLIEDMAEIYQKEVFPKVNQTDKVHVPLANTSNTVPKTDLDTNQRARSNTSNTSARRRKKTRNKLMKAPQEDVDQLLADYRSKGPPVVRTLTVYDFADFKLMKEFEMDLISEFPLDLVVTQCFSGHPGLSASQIEHPLFPQYHRVAAQFGNLTVITSVILDFIDRLFSLSPDRTRYVYDPRWLPIWLQQVNMALYGCSTTTGYYDSFKEDFFVSFNESSLTSNQKRMLNIMDTLHAAGHEAIELDTEFIEQWNLFGDLDVLRMASQFFWWLIDRILFDSVTEIMMTREELRGSPFEELIAGNDSFIEGILNHRVLELKTHLESAMISLWKFVENPDNITMNDTRETTQKLERLRLFDSSWGLTKTMFELAHILNEWTSVAELERFHIHMTKVAAWHDQDMQFFWKMIEAFNLKLVRYEVRRWSPDRGRSARRQDKSKRKRHLTAQQSPAKVWFSKYELFCNPT